jgi:N-methylhydantoinase A
VTDANVVLRRINPDNFLGGQMALDADSAHAALASRIAEPLGITVEEAALAMVDIVDAQLADLIRRVTVERGMDPAPFELDRWRRNFDSLEERLRDRVESEQLPAQDLRTTWFIELQFRGQVHTVRVPVRSADLEAQDGGEAIIDRFATLYEARYGAGTAYREAGVEAMTFAVEAIARLPVPELGWVEPKGAGEPAPTETRPVHLGNGSAEDVTIYAAADLHPGHSLEGPLVVEAEDTTVLVRPGHRMWIDGLRNLRIDLGDGPKIG